MNDKYEELEITDLAFDGKSVAHRDGKVVFLKGGLPGETVRARITRRKPRYDEGVVEEIITRSEMRIPAVCSHFEECGGCTWQDLGYEHQLAFKKKQVTDCIERIGGLNNVLIEDVIGSVELLNYRNKMEFSFHVQPESDFTLGLHRRGHFDQIFNLDACHLQSSLSNDIVAWVRDYVKKEGIPVYDVRNHTGYMRFLVIRTGKRTGQTMVNLVTNYGDFPNPTQLVESMRKAFPDITTIIHSQNGQKSNIATGEIEHILFGPGSIEERMFERRFRIRANSFFQTNSLQAEALYRTAFDMLEPQQTDSVLDLYCGTGSIGLLISDYVSEVTGVELVGDAVRIARENAALNEIENVLFFEGDVKDFLASPDVIGQIFSVVIVDPPRAGLHPKALKRLLELLPPKLLYISCNPSTFARDAKALVEAGYDLPKVQPVDMFPQTMHIELVGLFHHV